MQSLKLIYLCLCLVATAPAFSQKPSNPLLIHSNDPIAFDKIDAQMIRESVAQIIQISNGRVKQIIAGLKTGAGPGTTLAAYDDLSYDLNDLGMKLGLISQTYVSDSARDAANNGLQALSDYQTTLILNEPLYKALKAYAAASMSSLKPNQQKYIKDQLQIFENNGMKLDSAARRELQGISEKLTMIGLEFDNNISTSRDSITYTEPDLAGVPEDTQKKMEKTRWGICIIYQYPECVRHFEICRFRIHTQKMRSKI